MRRAGFTLVELLLALGLLAILSAALVQLLDTTLTIWDRTESERDRLDTAGALLELLERDVHGLEGGPRGDLVAEWRRYDPNGDGVPTLLAQRLVLVRRAGPSEWGRSAEGSSDEAADPRTGGLIEVAWALLPEASEDPDRRGVGVLWRGERRLGADSLSFFDERFFGAAGRPLPGTLEPLTGGVLWFEARFATQTSVLSDGPEWGWALGDGLADACASWDAFGRSRPDAALSFLNQPGAGMPAAQDLPLLPRRLRIALELERDADRKRRTRLAEEVLPGSGELFVLDEERLPPDGSFVLVGEEWMRVGARARGSVLVTRGERGTRAERHDAGSLVHHGARLVRELVVPGVREEWGL